jgi:hypothetical protein
MKKILALLVVSAIAVSCGNDTPDPTDKKYATDSLTVSPSQNVLVFETTGAWCQYCPNGAAALRKAILRNPEGRILGMAAHTGDVLETPVATLLNTMWPASGVPNFYINGNDAGQSIAGPIAASLTSIPEMGVATAVAETDTSYEVYAKVQVFKETRGTTYTVQSYLMYEGLDAKQYGLIDLNQVSSVPVVTKGSGAQPSIWAVDTVGKKAGDVYQHEHLPIMPSITSNPFGIVLDTVNPLGNNFFEGDIFGTQYTPIKLRISKKPLAALNAIVPLDPKKFYVLTVVWKERLDGTGGFLFVNGIEDHLE